jgi:hypothetical protein
MSEQPRSRAGPCLRSKGRERWLALRNAELKMGKELTKGEECGLDGPDDDFSL